MPSNRKKSDVLVIGELNMDLILSGVKSFPELGKEKTADVMNLVMGSSSAIFAANCARLGCSVEFCGMVGQDDFGVKIVDQLQEFGVDTSLIIASQKYKTGLTVIIKQAEDRAMLTYPGAMAQFSLSDIPDEAFRRARHLHISSVFLQPGLKEDLFEIIKRAKANGMTISIDPQWDPDGRWDLDVKKLLPEIVFIIPNEAEFLNLTASRTVDEGFQKFRNERHGSIIVKRGIKGATFLGGGYLSTLPAFVNKKPVDAVGAGDSFDAGFIYRFLKGDPVKNCVHFGNLTGAVSTTKAGGTAAITSLDQVLKVAKNTFSTTQFDVLID
jgi:sugar/nucleoside kinase (ribokinase family)